jgi:cytochrome P450
MDSVSITGDDAGRRDVSELFKPFSSLYMEDPARAFYLRAHAEAPVVYSQTFNAWLVTGHAEVTHVLRSAELFSSAKILDLPPQPPEVYAVLARAVFPLPPGLFNNDPPGHTRARSLFSKAFTSARTAALEPAIHATAASLIAQMSRVDGVVDLMQAFAFALPLAIDAALVGVPAEDATMLKAWQDEWFLLYDQQQPLARRIQAAEAVVEHHEYLRSLVEARRRAPREDFVSALVQARHEDARPLSTEEVVSHLIVLFVAGYETAAGLIGSLMLRLLEQRARWDAIPLDDVRLQGAIEETLRMDAPVQMEPRHVTQDTELAGRALPRDAVVFPFFGAANYDAGLFPDPLRFDERRPRAPRHYAFGHGIHTCIGANLGRLEAQIAARSLRRAFPRLRLASDARPSITPSLFFRVPAELLVLLEG